MARSKKKDFTIEDLNKVTEWNNKAKELQTVKTDEFALRNAIVFEMGAFDDEKLEGSQTIEIAAYPGWKLSADKVMNYTCVGVPEILEVQNLIGSATGLNRPDLAQNLVKYKPELSVKGYRDALAALEQAEKDGNPEVQELAAKLKAAMAKAITIKKGAPQLELIAPKE